MSYLSYDAYAKSLSDCELQREVEYGRKSIPGSLMLAALEAEREERLGQAA